MGTLEKLIAWVSGRERASRPSEGKSLAAANQLIDFGNALELRGDLEGALEAYQTALTRVPGFARAHLNIGNIRLAKNDGAGAMSAFETALQVQPDYPGAHFNIGNAHRKADRPDQALLAYERAIAQRPDFLDAKIARASLLDDIGRVDSSAAAYEAVLVQTPDFPEVRVDYAYVLSRQCRFTEALAQCRQALAAQPDLAKALSLEASLLKDTGRFEEALQCYEHAIAQHPDSQPLLSGLLFTANYRAARPDASLVALAQRYGELAHIHAKPFLTWDNPREPDRVLRIGFVSGDLRSHPVAHFLESILQALRVQDPRRLTLVAYSASAAEDSTTGRLRGLFDLWRDASQLNDEALAQLVRQDRIDILVDLAGHTAHSRLQMFAYKPAPVQAAWLGYFATTGLAAIDHVLVDAWSLPAGEEHDFVETPWRLPETRLCFTAPAEDVVVSDLPALRNGVVTFGCFNHLAKMGDEVVAVWSSILNSVPGSRLLLKSPPLAESGTRIEILTRFGRQGVDPERIITEGLSSRRAYLESYHRVDIALDPFPYPGGTTSAEALWMGVPFVTLKGHRLLARQGSGMLNCLGLSDWIANDEQQYLRIAVAKAGDPGSLAALRRELRGRSVASPLFDAPRFASHFSDAMQGMWRRWCQAKA